MRTTCGLACHGLDKNDNDFIVGLLGPNLHPLSAVVQELREHRADVAVPTSNLGPFFVGKCRVAAAAVTANEHDYDALLVVSFGEHRRPG